MHPIGKIAGLSLFIFISLVCVKPLFGEESPINLESFINRIINPVENPPVNDESSPVEEPLSVDETFLDDEFDESFFFEAPPLIIEALPFSGIRSFDEIFSNLSPDQRKLVMSNVGLKYSFEKDGSPMIIPDPDSGINLLTTVMKRKPSHVVEALVLVPYSERELDLLDVYNALSRIKNIQDQQIIVNGVNANTFTETTRLDNAKSRKPISDPMPADILPFSETMYLRLVDKYIGDLYVRGEISVSLYGITYDMTNFRDVSYFIFRVMKAERFTAIIYIEPVVEGVLIYGMSGMYLPGFIVSKVNLTPNMNRRINILISWITEGLRYESKRQRIHFYQNPVGE